MKPSSLLLSTSKNRYSRKNQNPKKVNIQPSGRDKHSKPNNIVMGKETFSSSAFQMMLSSATRKGQVTCIGLKRKKSKSR